MIVIDCIQGSDEWFKEKIGKPSASNASKIVMNDGKQSKQREGYMYQLAAEIVTQKAAEGYQSKDMLAGKEREEEARTYYEILKGVDVKEVGVVYKDKKKKFLCSPDGLIGSKLGLEMKNPLPKTQVDYLLSGKLPSTYFSQIQFSLYVTGFKHWDFLSYVPDMRPLIIRVERDEDFLAALEFELNLFCKELEIITNKIKG